MFGSKKPAQSAVQALAASSKAKQKDKRVPVQSVTANDELSEMIREYLKLSEEETKIKAKKASLNETIRSVGQGLYADVCFNNKHAVPSSIRMEASPEEALLLITTDAYAVPTEDSLELLRKAELYDKYTRTQISLNFDKAEANLKEKVAQILLNNLTEMERSQLITSKTVVREGALFELIDTAKDAKEISRYIDLLSPTQQLKKG